MASWTSDIQNIQCNAFGFDFGQKYVSNFKQKLLRYKRACGYIGSKKNKKWDGPISIQWDVRQHNPSLQDKHNQKKINALLDLGNVKFTLIEDQLRQEFHVYDKQMFGSQLPNHMKVGSNLIGPQYQREQDITSISLDCSKRVKLC